ncbi:hypothetical protein [Paenibacillus hamazuiensis]|uniref:hypothetical protein n=1 Tax=Paenibacillus hamazuiensis TaxID=2936508 RepID=UPI00200D9061|nr:hypothetical protein [Paenibacillus hamazuiensis]
MKKYILTMATKTPLSIMFFISLINYYLLAIIIAGRYDAKEQLSGAPATMYTMLFIGPLLSLILAVLTIISLRILRNYSKMGVIAAVAYFHYLILISLCCVFLFTIK